MKKIDTSFAIDPVRQPFMARSVAHLQEAYQEVIDAIVKSLAYDPTKPMILYGCVNSTTAPNYTLSAGAIYWGGEIYLVDAVTFTSPGSEVAVASIATTYQAGDPTLFSDSNAHDVHEIRKIVFASGAIASGEFDFSELVKLNPDIIYANLYSAPIFVVNSGSYQDFTSMDYTTPNDGITRKYKISFKATYITSNGVVDSSSLLRIRDTTNSLTLDEGRCGKSNFGTTEVPTGTIYLTTGVIEIDPNTNIKVQGVQVADNVSFEYNRMTIEQVR